MGDAEVAYIVGVSGFVDLLCTLRLRVDILRGGIGRRIVKNCEKEKEKEKEARLWLADTKRKGQKGKKQNQNKKNKKQGNRESRQSLRNVQDESRLTQNLYLGKMLVSRVRTGGQREREREREICGQQTHTVARRTIGEAPGMASLFGSALFITAPASRVVAM